MRYVLGTLAIIIVAIVAIVAIVSRSPRRASDQPAETTVKVTDLENKSASFVFMNEGPINSEEEHRAVRISVNDSVRKVEVLGGYKPTTIKQQTFSNNSESYKTFIKALQQAGFASAPSDPPDHDEKGVCPLGSRRIYEILSEGKTVLHLWSTSCGDKGDNFAGNESMVKELFETQIPEYDKFVSDVEF